MKICILKVAGYIPGWKRILQDIHFLIKSPKLILKILHISLQVVHFQQGRVGGRQH